MVVQFYPKWPKFICKILRSRIQITPIVAVWNWRGVMYGINPKESYTLTRDTMRLRRFHTNPSDWIEKSRLLGVPVIKQVLK